MPLPTRWIAVDWGTSRLRTWAVGDDGAVLAQASSHAGMGTLAPDGYEPALLALVGDWLAAERDAVTVIVCGMAGARQGWCEAPYVETPCAPPGPARAVRPGLRFDRLDVMILPGVAQREPPDVMRGEETQIAGWLAERPDFAGLLCLPGTHTKWVTIENGRILRFTTVMTGELYAAASTATVLRHALDGGWDEDVYRDTVERALGDPTALAARLFSIRAASLLGHIKPGTGNARLSGELIGTEVAGLGDVRQLGEIVVLGDGELASRYATALSLAGVTPAVVSAEPQVLRGLGAAFRSLEIS